MEINLENMIIIKKEWFRSTCPTLRVTTKRIRLNKIGLSVLNNPKDISVCADLENKKIIVSAADVAEDHTAFLEDLFHSMNWNVFCKSVLSVIAFEKCRYLQLHFVGNCIRTIAG